MAKTIINCFRANGARKQIQQKEKIACHRFNSESFLGYKA
jgi:hypothetical protein